MAKQYDLAGVHFESQSALERAVKEYLRDTAPKDRVFKSRFLRDIVNTLHPAVIAESQRSTGEFEFLTYYEQVRRNLPYADLYRGGPVMITFFEPLHDWRDVTVYPWRKRTKNPRTEIAEALRAKIAATLPVPTPKDRCATPGCSVTGFGLRYHHVEPSFAQIAEECLEMMTEEEIRTLFGYGKFLPGIYCVADCIPDDHPAVVHLFQAHEHNEWIWLCDRHHMMMHSRAA